MRRQCFRKDFPIFTSFAFATLFCARWTSKPPCNFSAAELKKWAQAFPGCVRGRLGHPGRGWREVQSVLGPLPKGTLGGRTERSFEPGLAWLWDHRRASRRYTEGRNWGCQGNPRGQRPVALFPTPVQERPRRISGNWHPGGTRRAELHPLPVLRAEEQHRSANGAYCRHSRRKTHGIDNTRSTGVHGVKPYHRLHRSFRGRQKRELPTQRMPNQRNPRGIKANTIPLGFRRKGVQNEKQIGNQNAVDGVK